MSAFVVAAALLACSLCARADDLSMKEAAGLRYACGGVGVEERAALAMLRPQANLELLFVTAKRGGYLADVEVLVAPAEGAAAQALRVLAEGPICLLAAPAGRYRVEATYGGLVRRAQVEAGPSGIPARSVFAFPGEPWDGIRASDEEKQQARTP